MPDDKSKTGKPDRDRVAADEPYEVAYLANKFKVSEKLVRKAIKKAGPMRDDVEKEIKRRKKKKAKKKKEKKRRKALAP